MSESSTTDIPWSGVRCEWLSHADVGARYGAALCVSVPPGGGYEIHRHQEAERVAYLARGTGVHEGDGGPLAMSADDVVVLPPGTWHGFLNTGDTDAVMLLLYTPATRFPTHDYEPAGASTRFQDSVVNRQLHAVPGRPEVATRERGFEGFDVNWDGASPAERIVLGFARFPPGSTHHWHRHTRADEGAYFLEGRAHHRYMDGTEERDLFVAPDEHIWVPTGQWHTMVTEPSCPVLDCVWWYLGAPTLEATGYELRG